jgi:hypothetical protein
LSPIDVGLPSDNADEIDGIMTAGISMHIMRTAMVISNVIIYELSRVIAYNYCVLLCIMCVIGPLRIRLPNLLNLSAERLQSDGIYLLENSGIYDLT